LVNFPIFFKQKGLIPAGIGGPKGSLPHFTGNPQKKFGQGFLLNNLLGTEIGGFKPLWCLGKTLWERIVWGGTDFLFPENFPSLIGGFI